MAASASAELQGLLWAAIAWTAALSSSSRRWWWIGSAVTATAILTTFGLLSAFGVIGQVIAG